jgi:hypothetical protein
VSIASNFEQAKHFILPERDRDIQEQRYEKDFFQQQLYNEVRRSIMLDYMTGREHFIDVGEQ